MPRISVLMGIYNCAPTLQEALDSLYAQTFQDFKIILCDDGSKDDTLAIAERNAKEHPGKVLVIKNDKNMGLNYTLNHCLEYADTEYCARMDGDDISLPERFEKELQFLDQHPEYAFVSCPMYMFDTIGKWGQTRNKAFPTKEDVVFHNPCFTHAALMIRTKAYKDVGGYTISPWLLRVEDCHLWLKLYANQQIGANLQYTLYGMRDDRNATTRRTWVARRNAIYVMWLGYKMFNVPLLKYGNLIIASAVEIAKYLMPTFAYEYFHRRNK